MDGSWDVVAWFCLEQAMLAGDEPHHVHARACGARTYLTLTALWQARTGELAPRWRQKLPTAADSPSVDIVAAALEVASDPVRLWEPYAAGPGGLYQAACEWHRCALVALLDANFLMRDAIATGRSPDDDWHRLLPAAVQCAVHAAHLAVNTAVLSGPQLMDYIAQTPPPTHWHGDAALIAVKPPWYWNVARPMLPISPGIRPGFADGLQALYEKWEFAATGNE